MFENVTLKENIWRGINSGWFTDKTMNGLKLGQCSVFIKIGEWGHTF